MGRLTRGLFLDDKNTIIKAEEIIEIRKVTNIASIPKV